MTEHATRIFLPDLRDLERRIDAPIPERVKILRELEYDLDALRGELIERGMPPDQARRAALQALVPGEHAAGALTRVHTPWYGRITRRMDEDRLTRLERSALIVATVVVLLLQTAALLRGRLLEDPSPFLWPVLGLGSVLFAVAAGTGFRAWIKRDDSRPNTGMGLILGVAGITLLTGVTGGFIDTYRFGALLEGSPELAGTLVAPWLVRTAALLSVSLVLALAGAVAWFVLHQWAATLSASHREALGLGADRTDSHIQHQESS